MKLKGNSGLIYDKDGNLVMHISAPYDSNGMVFAEIYDEELNMLSWERMSLRQAHERNLNVIKCCQCPNPATQLDHYWPYFSGMNLCDEHEYNPECDA